MAVFRKGQEMGDLELQQLWPRPLEKLGVENVRICLARFAAALLLAVPTCISAAAFAQPAAIAVDREACINSGRAATPAAATAACTRLLEALAPGEIASPEGAAVYIARGNLYAVQGEVIGYCRLPACT
jgi:hypothetical protein